MSTDEEYSTATTVTQVMPTAEQSQNTERLGSRGPLGPGGALYINNVSEYCLFFHLSNLQLQTQIYDHGHIWKV